MPMFVYAARNAAGRPMKGTQEATSAPALVNTLRERGLLVVDVRPAEGPAPTVGDLLVLLHPGHWLPPRSVDIELSLLQMAVMLRSGLTLLTTLKTIAEYARRRAMRRVWDEVAEQIQRGASLADAMSAHRCFSHMVVQLVRVGEQTGTLEQVVTRASEGLERRRLLRTQLVTALFYPAVVVVAAIGVAIFIVVGVIPKLQVFLAALGRKLPPLTQALVDVADFFQVYGLTILIAIFALIATLIAVYLWPPGRLFLDRYMLRIPLFGGLLRLAATVQFAHGLAVLLQSGITLVEGLRTLEALYGNRWVAGRVVAARAAVLRGGALAPPLEFPGVFMPMLSRMVAVGESAGTLDEVLREVAKFHEKQLQGTIRLFSVIIEPVIIVVVGGIVGFVYIAFFMALFSAAGGAR